MKKIIVSICVILMALTLNAQEKKMYINLKTGNIKEFSISTIDSITFKVQQKKMLVNLKAPANVTEISYPTIQDITFKADAGTLPELTTSNASGVSTSGATLGGNITNAGTPAYTERGVCWSTSQNPTVSNNKKVVSGSGTGSFNTEVSGLTANTTYYVRAYAINTTGTAYGNQISFTTSTTSTAIVLTGPASNSTGTFDLTWTFNWPSPGASDDHYELEYSLNSTSGFQVIVVYPNGDKKSPYTAPVEVEAVDIGKTIYFRVRAKANGTYTQYSNVHAVSIPYVNANYYPLYQNNVAYDNNSSAVQYMVFKNEAAITAGYSYIIASPGSFNDWVIAMKWNISSMIQGKIIQKATLKLNVHTYAPNTNGNYKVAPIVSNWDNNTLCYANTPNIYLDPHAIKAIPTTSVWEIDITNIVKAWASGSIPNYGIAIYDADKSQGGTVGVLYNRKTNFYGIGQANNALKPTLYLEIR